MKQIFIILLLTMMGINVYSQDLYLHPKGIGGIFIDLVLDKAVQNFCPVEEHPRNKHIDRGVVRLYEYFFWKPKDGQIPMLSGAIKFNDFFLAINHYGIVEGIILFIPLSDIEKAITQINNVFGDAQLGGSSGAEGQTYSYKTYWHKDGVSLFLTQIIGEDTIQIFMHAPKLDGRLLPYIAWH